MILACHNLSKSFGDQVIVKDGSFHIENHEKAALVGINGAGKSTILKMIVGQLSPRCRDGCSYQRQNSRLPCTASGDGKRQYHLRRSPHGKSRSH